MSDTIFYTIKLKRTKTPGEVFERMLKTIKKKGPTKNWTCNVADDELIIDFGDEQSETFSLKFVNKVADGFCKVAFPLSGELFDDDKKSEFKALINMLYAARTSYSSMKITDDYGLAEGYLQSKEIKIKLRELNAEERERLDRIYASGVTEYKEFIKEIVKEGMQIPEGEQWTKYVNARLYLTERYIEDGKCYAKIDMLGLLETYLYETAEYKQNKRTRIWYEYQDAGTQFAVYDFVLGIQLLCKYKHIGMFKDVVDLSHYFTAARVCVPKFFEQIFYPEFMNAIDDYCRCELAYRYFLTLFDYCGFKYVGKEETQEIG